MASCSDDGDAGDVLRDARARRRGAMGQVTVADRSPELTTGDYAARGRVRSALRLVLARSRLSSASWLDGVRMLEP